MHGDTRRQQQTFVRTQSIAAQQSSSPLRRVVATRHRAPRRGASGHSSGCAAWPRKPRARDASSRAGNLTVCRVAARIRSSMSARAINVPSPMRMTAAFHSVACAKKNPTWVTRYLRKSGASRSCMAPGPHAAVGRHEAETAPERDLRCHDDDQTDGRDQHSEGIWRQRRVVSGSQHEWCGE